MRRNNGERPQLNHPYVRRSEMAARPSWEGHLRLSLVTCPVSLWSATTEAETVRFNLINPKTNNRIRMKTVDAGTGEELSRGDLAKGFAIAKDEYVLLDKEDFESVKLESTRIIDIEKFVTRETIDRLYWDTPYHLVPSGKTGIEAFAVIREAMKRKGMVAIGRLVMSTRERVCAIEIEEDGLVLTTLRTAEEVRQLDEIGHPDLPKPNPQMLEIAEKIVAQQSGAFDPAEFTDRYENALRALIEEKKRGKPVTSRPPREEAESGVVDLMAALKKSLQGAGSERKRAERYAAAAGANKKPSARGRRAA
jgi:DNA end-binding protein Ku